MRWQRAIQPCCSVGGVSFVVIRVIQITSATLLRRFIATNNMSKNANRIQVMIRSATVNHRTCVVAKPTLDAQQGPPATVTQVPSDVGTSAVTKTWNVVVILLIRHYVFLEQKQCV